MDYSKSYEQSERKKQLIAQGALHRAAICAERHATSQSLQPRTLAGGILQHVVTLGLNMLRDNTSATSAAGNPAHSSASAPNAWSAALASALPSTLPAALPLLIRSATSLVRLGRAVGSKLNRNTVLRSVVVAGAAAAVTAVVVMRKRKAAASTSAPSAEGDVSEPLATAQDDARSPH